MEGLSLNDCWVSRITAFNACSALVLLVWDWLTCLDEETTWIWPLPCSTTLKWVYFFCRYTAFGCHILNVLFIHRMEQYVSFPASTCRMWLAYQGIAIQIFLAVVEGLLIIRVYALWSRSKRICALLAIFFVIEIPSSAVTTSVVAEDGYFNQLCMIEKVPLVFVIFSIAALLVQLSIFVLALYKQRRFHRLQRPPLVIFVIRECSIVALTISAILIAGFVYVLLDAEHSGIMFYWMLSILSVCGCRLVLSVHRFSSAHRVELPVDQICLTSVFTIEQDPRVSS